MTKSCYQVRNLNSPSDDPDFPWLFALGAMVMFADLAMSAAPSSWTVSRVTTMATQSGEDGVGANATVLLVSKSGWMDVVCLRFVRVFVYFYLKLGKGWEITAWAVEFARKIERFPYIQREGIGFFFNICPSNNFWTILQQKVFFGYYYCWTAFWFLEGFKMLMMTMLLMFERS